MPDYFSKTIPDNPRNRNMVRDIRQAAAKYRETEIFELPFSKYRIYFETGSRVEYEACYIDHRRRLNVYTVMALSSGDPLWIKGLEDILWAVCNEFTWAFPAHIKDERDLPESSVTIDLFAAETGLAVSEACHLAGDRLSPLVRDRVKKEVERRILTPYRERELKFHKDNWSAVCAGCVAMAAMYWEGYEGYLSIEEKVTASMEDFLGSYQEDGCCLEGILYWGYGFGYFCYFAHMLRWFSGGKRDWFRREKVKQIALFRQRVSLEKDVAVPFADAPHNYGCHIGLTHFLAKEYEEAHVPEESCAAWFDQDIRHRFADLIRDLYWYDPELEKSRKEEELVIFEKSQWYLAKRPGYAFAAKAGRNNEPHNHNDVGHFVLYAGGRFILDDLGWPEYDKDYFGEKRYENLCASSFGHSVPVLGGAGQERGGSHRGCFLKAGENYLRMDISGAYPEGLCARLIREFKLSERSVCLSDRIEGTPFPVRERFVTRIRPVIEKGEEGDAVIIGDWRVRPVGVSCLAALEEHRFCPRLSICKTDMKPVETVWCVDFVIPEPCPEISFVIENISPAASVSTPPADRETVPGYTGGETSPPSS